VELEILEIVDVARHSSLAIGLKDSCQQIIVPLFTGLNMFRTLNAFGYFQNGGH
jgi:hypothetical protein